MGVYYDCAGVDAQADRSAASLGYEHVAAEPGGTEKCHQLQQERSKPQNAALLGQPKGEAVPKGPAAPAAASTGRPRAAHV